MVCLGTSSKTYHCPYVWNEKQKNTQETPQKTGFTQRIERENLTLRNRLKRLNRKTLGYSKSPEMHDKAIGTFIEREYYI